MRKTIHIEVCLTPHSTVVFHRAFSIDDNVSVDYALLIKACKVMFGSECMITFYEY